MTLLYTAPHPRCPEHGQMHWDVARLQWVCHGFDGEGCPLTVTREQLGWSCIGRTEGPVTFT